MVIRPEMVCEGVSLLLLTSQVCSLRRTMNLLLVSLTVDILEVAILAGDKIYTIIALAVRVEGVVLTEFMVGDG